MKESFRPSMGQMSLRSVISPFSANWAIRKPANQVNTSSGVPCR